MSRRPKYEEDWQRRKAYLFRSVFEEHHLSPVPEEERSIDSPRSGISPFSAVRQSQESPNTQSLELEEEKSIDSSRSVVSLASSVRQSQESPNHPNYRSYSPLPSLIIEKEPIVYKHDDPPESYILLKKRMLKLYRKMFIEDRSDVSIDSDSTDIRTTYSDYYNLDLRPSFDENYHDEGTFKTVRNDITQRKGTIYTYDTANENDLKMNGASKFSASSVDLIESEHNVSSQSTYVIEEKISSSTDILPNSTMGDLTDEEENKTEKTETSSKSSDNDYRQVTIIADVHKDANEQVVQTAPILILEQGDVRDDNKDKWVVHKVDMNLAELEKNDVSDIEKKTHDFQPIEVMRNPRNYTSAGSVPKKTNDETHYSIEDGVRERHWSLEASTECSSTQESYENNMDIEESMNIECDILQTVLNGKKHSSEKRELQNISKRKRTLQMSVLDDNTNDSVSNVKKYGDDISTSKRIRYEDVGVQTKFNFPCRRLSKKDVGVQTNLDFPCRRVNNVDVGVQTDFYYTSRRVRNVEIGVQTDFEGSEILNIILRILDDYIYVGLPRRFMRF